MKDRLKCSRFEWASSNLLLKVLLGLLMATTGNACGESEDANISTGDSDTIDSSHAEGTVDSLAIPLRTSDGKPARFAFRSGLVIMRYTGDYLGTRRLIFDDYGLKEAKFDSAVPANTSAALVPPYQLTIITPEYYGGVDFRSGEGQKAKNAAYSRYVSSLEAETKPFGEMALERSGGTRLPDTTLMGKYPCRVYRRTQTSYTHTMWVWGGIPIREEMKVSGEMSGNYLLEPVSIETGIDVPDSLFTFPKEFKITEIEPPPGQ